MNKTAAKSRATDEASVRQAQRLFFIRLAEMSGKLAGAFLIPALFGIFLDNKLYKNNSLSIVGILIGLLLSVLVIKHMVSKLDKETSSS